jgi:tRNA-specific 2-thiouridylase
VREIAAKVQLPSALRPDSQGICFLGKINYNEFIRRYVGEKKGRIVEWETGRILGEHKGFWFHTIGQRKGLGLSLGPWLVVRKNPEENVVYVSHGYNPESVYQTHIPLSGFTFIAHNPYGEDFYTRRIAFKIRHTPEFSFGTLTQTGKTLTIHSETPHHGVAAGQYAVLYDEDCRICLGSGMIA